MATVVSLGTFPSKLRDWDFEPSYAGMIIPRNKLVSGHAQKQKRTAGALNTDDNFTRIWERCNKTHAPKLGSLER